MEKINEENKMMALIHATVCDTTAIYQKTTQILPQIRHTQNPRKTEEQEISILPIFLHIATCYLTIIKTDHISTFIDYVKDKCNHFESMGLDGSSILHNIKCKMLIFHQFTKQHNDFVHQNLDWFQQRLFDIYVTCNPYNYKTIEPPNITNKFRPLCPVVTRETNIDESGDEFVNYTISNIVVIQGGIITYSHHCMTIFCMTRDGDRNDVHCPSPVTDFTRIALDTVLATLPFRRIILIINPFSFKTQRLPIALYKVSYLEHFSLVGVEMFSRTIYFVDWLHNRITKQFITKEIPAAIAVGQRAKLLISFSNSNIVTCYELDGHQLFEVEIHSLDLAAEITFSQKHFYVLQGHIIYRISATGGVIQSDIGRNCRSISVGTDAILVTDYFGKPHAIETNKDFWPKLSCNHQLPTPSLKDYIYIQDSNNITNILPMSTSSILIIYRNKKTILFTETGEIISQNDLTFLELPSFYCRINTNKFLVFYPEMNRLQYITCPELTEGPLIKVHTNYTKICHIVSNKCLAVTTTENKNEIHILLINEDKVDIIERISLGHSNVTIAATPINFVVVDGSKHKLVFYSTCGEELFQKYLPFYGYPHHIYSDNVYFYLLFKRDSILICYDIYGEMKWQWQLPFPVHPHIAVFQGTVYLPDTQLNRVLLYKYQDRSSGCCLHLKNPYIRNLNLRLKEKENDKKLVIGEICNLDNGQLVVSDINHDCLLYISNEGDIVSRLSLPSPATDICRWDSHQIGVTLPLQKQLRVIGNLSKTVRSVSLRQPYVRVCKMGEGEIVCYCDKPSHLDILAINYHNQVAIIHRINIPFVVKSLFIDKKTQKLLIVTRGKAFQYNTRIDIGRRLHSIEIPFKVSVSQTESCLVHLGHQRRYCIKMVPSVLLSQVKCPSNLNGGSIDEMFVYLIDNCRMFAINNHNLWVNDLVTNNQLNIYIDLVDVFSRNICVSEMLSSTLYLQNLTVSDKGRHIRLPGETLLVLTCCLVITENNVIVVGDGMNRNIKIFTFDGELLDSIKFNAFPLMMMFRWQSDTIVITTLGPHVKKYQLWTLKLEFPLSLVIYHTKNKYKYIASLSNSQLVCSRWVDDRSLYFIDIDEIHSTVNAIRRINIPNTLLSRYKENGRIYMNDIQDIAVTADDDIIVLNKRFIIFFNSDGQCLHSVRHYMGYYEDYFNMMTIDESYLYIYGEWEKYFGLTEYDKIVCLTQTGEYSRIFLNKRIYKEVVDFSSINCKGSRFVGAHKMRFNELYVEGSFMLNREKFSVCRLQTDNCTVQVKDIDISDEGKTVVCEKANNGNIKIFDEDGKLLCYRNVASLVGGVCFTRERDIMATVPNRQEIFQLNGKDLEKCKVWECQVPYGVIWRKVRNIYWCVHINLIECHCIKLDGDQVNILESLTLLNLDSGLHFPSIINQMNKEIFSNELVNKLKYNGEERSKPGEIIGKGGLKVRCWNYIADSMSGIDEISVRRMPHRTAMVPLSIPTFYEPVNYDYLNISDQNSKLIKLNDNVSVLMFRESVTLIGTITGDILQHKQFPKQQQPLGICQWTDECFIVTFGKEMMAFNRDLYCLKAIKTEKYYNTIYKYNDNQLVCGGHYMRDITQDERDKNYTRKNYNNNIYYFCKDPDAYDCYYVDVVDMKDGKCKDEVCRGKTKIFRKLEGEALVVDVGVTSLGDVVVVRWEETMDNWCYATFVEWFRKKSLVRRIRLKGNHLGQEYNIDKAHLIAISEYVYITDRKNNIYQIPGHIELQTTEDIEILTSEDNQKYLLLRCDDNEVYEVLGFNISENSFMVFGIIPGRQSFAFFHYDK